MIACIANFSAVPHRVPGRPARAGRWREVLNTDAAIYGGSGVGNFGGIEAVPDPGTAIRRRPAHRAPAGRSLAHSRALGRSLAPRALVGRSLAPPPERAFS